MGLRLELGYWLLVGCVTLAFRGPILSLFVAGRAADVVALGSEYLGYMAVFYALPALTKRFPGILPRHGQDDDDADRDLYTGGSARRRAAVLALRGAAGHRLCLSFGWCVMLAFEVPHYFWTCKEGL